MKFLVTLLSGVILIGTAHAAELTPEEIDRKIQRIESHPCFGALGPERSICRQEQGRGSSLERREMTGIGRRVQALRQGQEDQRSLLVPKWMPLSRAYTVDLRTKKQQWNGPSRIRRIMGSENPEEETAEAPRRSLIQRRALGGIRGEGTTLACRAMEGLRLLTCLRERGIEINQRTVDAETWELYRLQQPAAEPLPVSDESQEEPVQE